jgi:HsdM N-terminal domain
MPSREFLISLLSTLLPTCSVPKESVMRKGKKELRKRARQSKATGKPDKKRSTKSDNGSDALVGFEAKLWQMADKLRNNMDAAEYKHVVLGLIFLKYISDAFEEKHAALVADKKSGADPEDPEEYRAETIFWVPKEARWIFLQGNATQPKIGKLVDDAMLAIEQDVCARATVTTLLPQSLSVAEISCTKASDRE